MARSALSLLNCLLVCTTASAALFGFAGWVASSALGAPKGEPVFAAAFAAFLGALFGGFVATMIWAIRVSINLIKRGRSWVNEYTADRSDSSPSREFDRNGYYIYRTENPDAALELDDPWRGQNPHGCCRNHVDNEGYPSHGGPDCVHPFLSRTMF